MRKCNCCERVVNEVKEFRIESRGYGSQFDCHDATIYLCSECAAKVKQEWFDEKPIVINHVEKYTYEDNIISFIDNNFNNPDIFWLDDSVKGMEELEAQLDKLENREFNDNWKSYYNEEVMENMVG